MFASKHFLEDELPSFGISFLCALVPVLLMAFATMAEFILPVKSQSIVILKFIGDPGISMLIALLAALIFLGIGRELK